MAYVAMNVIIKQKYKLQQAFIMYFINLPNQKMACCNLLILLSC